jgi:membrane fusion protein, multidrug efflux system
MPEHVANQVPCVPFLAWSPCWSAGCSREAPPPEPVRAVRTVTVSATEAGGSAGVRGRGPCAHRVAAGFRVGGKLVRGWSNPGRQVQAPGRCWPAGPAGPAPGPAGRARRLGGGRGPAERWRRPTSGATRNCTTRASSVRPSSSGARPALKAPRRNSTRRARRPGAGQPGGLRACAPMRRHRHRCGRRARDVRRRRRAGAAPGARRPARRGLRRARGPGGRDPGAAGTPGRFKVRPWGDAQALLPATMREVSAAADPVTRTFQVKADIGSGRSLRWGRPPRCWWTCRAGGREQAAADGAEGSTRAPAVWVVDPATMTVRLQPVVVAGADGNDASSALA